MSCSLTSSALGLAQTRSSARSTNPRHGKWPPLFGNAGLELATGSRAPINQLLQGRPAARGVGSSRGAAVDELETAAVPLATGRGVCIEAVSFEDGTYTVRGRLESAASPELVYEVLTDYASLARVFHNVVDSQLLHVGEEKHLVQTCKWAFLIFSGTFKTSLAVSEDPASRRLAFHLVQSSFMRQFVGRWVVEAAPAAPASAGGSAAGRSVITHSLAVRPAVAPPRAVAHYTSKIFRQQVENILGDLQAELQRRQAEEQHHQQR